MRSYLPYRGVHKLPSDSLWLHVFLGLFNELIELLNKLNYFLRHKKFKFTVKNKINWFFDVSMFNLSCVKKKSTTQWPSQCSCETSPSNPTLSNTSRWYMTSAGWLFWSIYKLSLGNSYIKLYFIIIFIEIFMGFLLFLRFK